MKEERKESQSLFSYIKKQKGSVLIIVLVCIALLLLVIPENEAKTQVADINQRMNEYEERLERKITDLCESVRGVSAVKVSIYFNSGFESVYAYDEESKSDSDSVNSEKKYVTVGSGNDESMVCLFERMPDISGIAVVCRGGGNPIIANELINMLSASFGVPKNKIYITEGKN